ncbi:DEAD/DEAH box helicase [Legionella gresilensis]|uniref:DEAD/DEAH box helicase n=1 Tax=Legionella gresilensis TaxID=91823 RepID=UPI0010418301|nr:DEAD/DEAH box helicase [Legionella gresilensis]
MNFQALGLIDTLVQTVHKLGYNNPTPIQAKAIPPILNKQDVLASAQTGTGKTASFVLPILQLLSKNPRAKDRRIQALILTPTRELAAQVCDSIKEYSHNLTLRSTVVFGGVKINPQMMKLRSGVEILVATPGRLIDLHQQNAIKLDKLEMFILDEADRMLDMGFIHDIKRIIRLLPAKRQNLMFSATFSNDIRALAKGILHNPVEIDVAPRNTSAINIKQTIHPVDKTRKAALLCHLIHHNKWDQAIVFSRTKHGANKLVKQLAEAQIHAVAIHGNKSQSQRTKALTEFKEGEVQILVATDLAARGIDIEKLPCVINFDLPQVAEDYVHRIGRTGRAGSTGQAISLVSADEIGLLVAIENLIKKKLNRIEISDFEPVHNLPQSIVKSQSITRYNAAQPKAKQIKKTKKWINTKKYNKKNVKTNNNTFN